MKSTLQLRARLLGALALAASLVLVSAAQAQAPATPKAAAKPAPKGLVKDPPLLIEPRALDLLKAASAKLAAAPSLAFDATVNIEYPSRLGPPLAYAARYEVAMQRPDKLRVLLKGAGPATEFYYDGKTVMAYLPEQNLVAMADAPPTVEAALKLAYERSGTYFPFTDLLLADPYAALTDKVIHAFYIGPSGAVGGVSTEAIAWATKDVFMQAWIGTEDKLPRRLRAIYAADPLLLRHDMELSNWRLDAVHPAGTFASAKAQAGQRIAFGMPVAAAPPPRAKTTARPAKPAMAASAAVAKP